MGSLYRSEEMCLAQLYLQTEAAFACVSELGELGLAEFIDLNPVVNAFQRKFVTEVRRCDEMERKLRFLERELKKDNYPITDNGENPLAPLPKEMIDLEAKFEKLENDMKEVNINQEQLKRNFLELSELKHILRKTQRFFEEAALRPELNEAVDDEQQPLLASDNRGPSSKLGFVAGVILRGKVLAFERVLWRACRGNVFLRYSDIEEDFEDPTSGEMVSKSVFVIFFQGDQLKSRVKKICEGFHATLYPCPDNAKERRQVAIGVLTRIEDLQIVLNQTEDHRKLVLSQVALNIRVWLIKVRKIKAIYHTLNLFNVNIAEKCLIGECWCPVSDLDKIQFALRRGTEASGSSVPSILHQTRTTQSPPTYNKTDKFTSGFQSLIDSFGFANYREVNPTPFTIITFPFLFGIMFGDLGHGLLMFLFGLYCVLNEKRFEAAKDKNEIWEMMFGGRYLILLMGLFSMYTGFLYNECFSRSLNVFGSAWNVSAMDYSHKLLKSTPMLQLNPAIDGVYRRYPEYPFNNASLGNPYPYGMDPIWQSALNKITFQNSYKMKSAVIVGLCQMVFGLILALNNHLYFRQYLSIIGEWLPQMLFMLAVIGYLCALIIYKWAMWTVAQSNEAPSLLIGLINMFMFVAPNATQNNYPVYGAPDSKTQYYIQVAIVLVAVICIPWMLLTKPAVLLSRHKKRSKKNHPDRVGVNSDVSKEENAALLENEHTAIVEEAVFGEQQKEEEEFVFGEIMIHQMIHTIEYCLSCISHTASYLRLWALSLAHSGPVPGDLAWVCQVLLGYLTAFALVLEDSSHPELSEVLWTMVMHSGLAVKGYAGAVFAFVIFWGFAALTVAILLVMEGLSAFLHALRLHWVEFQSKFYGGEGHVFVPFSFDMIVEGNIEDA